MRVPDECEVPVLDHMRCRCSACMHCVCRWRQAVMDKFARKVAAPRRVRKKPSRRSPRLRVAVRHRHKSPSAARPAALFRQRRTRSLSRSPCRSRCSPLRSPKVTWWFGHYDPKDDVWDKKGAGNPPNPRAAWKSVWKTCPLNESADYKKQPKVMLSSESGGDRRTDFCDRVAMDGTIEPSVLRHQNSSLRHQKQKQQRHHYHPASLSTTEEAEMRMREAEERRRGIDRRTERTMRGREEERGESRVSGRCGKCESDNNNTDDTSNCPPSSFSDSQGRRKDSPLSLRELMGSQHVPRDEGIPGITALNPPRDAYYKTGPGNSHYKNGSREMYKNGSRDLDLYTQGSGELYRNGFDDHYTRRKETNKESYTADVSPHTSQSDTANRYRHRAAPGGGRSPYRRSPQDARDGGLSPGISQNCTITLADLIETRTRDRSLRRSRLKEGEGCGECVGHSHETGGRGGGGGRGGNGYGYNPPANVWGDRDRENTFRYGSPAGVRGQTDTHARSPNTAHDRRGWGNDDTDGYGGRNGRTRRHDREREDFFDSRPHRNHVSSFSPPSYSRQPSPPSPPPPPHPPPLPSVLGAGGGIAGLEGATNASHWGSTSSSTERRDLSDTRGGGGGGGYWPGLTSWEGGGGGGGRDVTRGWEEEEGSRHLTTGDPTHFRQLSPSASSPSPQEHRHTNSKSHHNHTSTKSHHNHSHTKSHRNHTSTKSQPYPNSKPQHYRSNTHQPPPESSPPSRQSPATPQRHSTEPGHTGRSQRDDRGDPHVGHRYRRCGQGAKVVQTGATAYMEDVMRAPPGGGGGGGGGGESSRTRPVVGGCQGQGQGRGQGQGQGQTRVRVFGMCPVSEGDGGVFGSRGGGSCGGGSCGGGSCGGGCGGGQGSGCGHVSPRAPTSTSRRSRSRTRKKPADVTHHECDTSDRSAGSFSPSRHRHDLDIDREHRRHDLDPDANTYDSPQHDRHCSVSPVYDSPQHDRHCSVSPVYDSPQHDRHPSVTPAYDSSRNHAAAKDKEKLLQQQGNGYSNTHSDVNDRSDVTGHHKKPRRSASACSVLHPPPPPLLPSLRVLSEPAPRCEREWVRNHVSLMEQCGRERHRTARERMKRIAARSQGLRESVGGLRVDLDEVERRMDRVYKLQERFLRRTEAAVRMARVTTGQCVAGAGRWSGGGGRTSGGQGRCSNKNRNNSNDNNDSNDNNNN
ncbi:filaggrin-2, partial [Aplysia californica]|uniref:Filaggrin-2 n=1 Tax=Aplysia californica TaxID=6500 RepID=A0ABM1AEK4_APLCA